MLKYLGIKIGMVVAAMALAIGTMSAGIACMSWFHQPEMPAKLRKH